MEIDWLFCKYLPNRYYAKTDKTFASKAGAPENTVHIGHETNTTRMILFFTFFVEEVYTTS